MKHWYCQQCHKVIPFIEEEKLVMKVCNNPCGQEMEVRYEVTF